jgi:hypothetical protein
MMNGRNLPHPIRCTRAILNQHLLADDLGKLRRNQTHGDIGNAAGRKADDDAHRFCGIGLRANALGKNTW